MTGVALEIDKNATVPQSVGTISLWPGTPGTCGVCCVDGDVAWRIFQAVAKL